MLPCLGQVHILDLPVGFVEHSVRLLHRKYHVSRVVGDILLPRALLFLPEVGT